MSTLTYSLISAFVVSLLSLLGAFTLPFKEHKVNKALIYMVSFAAGGLMGGAFFHLLPEVLGLSKDYTTVFIYVIIGFCLFFILEKYLRWHHCHDEKCESHTHTHIGYLTLFGDFLHNLLDGIIIVSSFAISKDLGFIVTLSIIFHEIPQELGNYGVLIYSGFPRLKALFLNYLTGMVSILGVVIGYFLITQVASLNLALVSLAAGGFIYVAAADFIPELHKENNTLASILVFCVFLLALGFMLTVKLLGIE